MHQKLNVPQFLFSVIVSIVAVFGFLSLKPTQTKEEQEIRALSEAFGVPIEDVRRQYRRVRYGR